MRAELLTEELKRMALGEGFDLVAVARAERLERDGAALDAWLRGSRHAAMAWMARDPEKRADPGRLLPGCRSVVALAMNYDPGDPPGRECAGSGRVARYARSRDYHRVIGPKLRRMAVWLEQASGLPARGFVDTGPVLERAWAERSGLGWIGKNACLLTREFGSWVLLAELLCVAELVPDAGPQPDQCGSCTACLEACPTGAIVADGIVDSNLCIAYWTIEHRGSIPLERRPDNGDWLFGCDECQEICPWNRRFARPAPAERLGRRTDLDRLDAVAILAMDEPCFRGRYSGTPLMRAKWEGMRRNACVVLGNDGDARALSELTRALDDPEPVIRDHAAWAIRALGERQVDGDENEVT